jgi:hypothetical protein
MGNQEAGDNKQPCHADDMGVNALGQRGGS